MPGRDSHCTFCGAPFSPADVEARRWPRNCSGCGNPSYKNPIPVAVVLVPVDAGLLVIRRGIPPQKGMLALPGGFIDYAESWQAAGAREVWEETGLRITADELRIFDVKSASDGPLLLFCLAAHRDGASLPPFEPTDETTERRVIDRPEALAFPFHTEAVEAWFQGRR